MPNRRQNARSLSQAQLAEIHARAERTKLAAQRVSKRAAKSRARERDLYRGLIVAGSLSLLLACLLAGGYGVHSRMTATSERLALRKLEAALATGAQLRDAPVLFVPDYGNICRKRLLDNADWTLRDGGEVGCDNEAMWNSYAQVPEHNVGQRLDAVRHGFRAKAAE